MTEAEFEAWVALDKHFPLDDHHRIYRPAAMVAASFSGQYEERLNRLSPDPRSKSRELRPAQIVRKKE